MIFNFEKAHFILDEFIIGGEIQETSVKVGIQAVESQDGIMEREIEEASQLFPSLNKSARNNISSSGVHSNTDMCEREWKNWKKNEKVKMKKWKWKNSKLKKVKNGIKFTFLVFSK